MRKIVIRLTAGLALTGLLMSCSLEETRESFVSPKDFYQNEAQIVAGLNSCYIPLKSIYSFEFAICTEGVTDLMSIASGQQDAQLDITPANPRFGNTVWNQCYVGIRNAQACIYGILSSPVEESLKPRYLAEAKAMRAFYYYLLTSFFGDVPYYTDNVDRLEVLEKVGHLPRMSAVETRADLIKDLKACVKDLPEGRSYDVARQRAGSAFAYTVLAKLAMWNKDWETAKEALLKIQEFYGPLSQYPLSDVPFRMKNTPESIFEIQHTWSAGGLKIYSSFACITMPYNRKEDTDIYDGVSVPELGDQAIPYVPLRPNYYMCQGLMPKGSSDKRKDMTFVYEWNGQPFKGTSAKPYLGPKFWCYGMMKTYDDNNYKVFRYADCLLMLAETYCELGENDLSIACLNEVKTRADIQLYGKFRTKERLLEEIRNERARELVGEFQRKFDLVRWGIWYQATYEFTDYSILKRNIRPYHEYYPISDYEVALSGGILTNDAYNEGSAI